MADAIPDLWSEDIQVDNLSPVIILNTQAAILQKRTKGVVVAEVIKRKYGEVTELSFDIKAQVARHRSRLLTCRYLGEDVYPNWLTSLTLLEIGGEVGSDEATRLHLHPDDIDSTCFAPDQDRFMDLVSRVFGAGWVKSKISSMIAVANEAKQPLEHLIDETVTNQPAVPAR